MTDEVDSIQSTTGPKDNNPSTASAATGKVRRPGLIAGAVAGVVGLSWKLFMLPISIIFGVVRLITGSIGLGFRVAGGVLSYSLRITGLTRSLRHREPPSSPPVSVPVSAASEAVDFLSEFESQYGKIHPNFIPGGFTEAIQRSRPEFKLLFVYLHSPDHPDTPSFCEKTLCSEVLSAYINENFVAWGDSISTNGGLEISKSLNASRFPFCAVIMATTGQSISLLRQFEGPSSPEEMLKKLQTVLEESDSAIDAARQRKNMQLKEEQNAADQAEIEADQAKEDQNQLEREAELAQWCEEKASSLGPEPEKGPDVTQVIIRLPNGERKGRRFNCNATLQSVYDFVDSTGCLEVGSYTLVTFFPRVLYGQDEVSSTLEQLGLHPQASLFVELNT